MMKTIDPDTKNLLDVNVVISIAYFPNIPVGLTRSRTMKMT
jgi:hypothetical protein